MFVICRVDLPKFVSLAKINGATRNSKIEEIIQGLGKYFPRKRTIQVKAHNALLNE